MNNTGNDVNNGTIGFVLLSGGIDSTTALQYAVNQLGRRAHIRCVSVDYGQRHFKEIHHARQVANYYGKPHEVLSIEGMPKAMLTNRDSEIPSVSYSDLPHGISPTYVPFRNGQLLAKLAGHVQAYLKALDDKASSSPDGVRPLDPPRNAIIYFGAHAEDSANWAYPDCTPEFVGAMANAIFIGTYQRVRLETPWQYSMKHEIISYGARYKVPYHLTWSCYKGEQLHCGVCPTCRARKEAFELAGVRDLTDYAPAPGTHSHPDGAQDGMNLMPPVEQVRPQSGEILYVDPITGTTGSINGDVSKDSSSSSSNIGSDSIEGVAK